MPGVMRSHTAAHDHPSMFVMRDLRIFLSEFIEQRAAFFFFFTEIDLALGGKGDLHGGLVTAPSGRQKNDRRQQIMPTQRRDQFRWSYFCLCRSQIALFISVSPPSDR